jgi:hypothetical protein
MTRFPEAVLLLLVGAVLGPDGLGLLSDAVLAIIDPGTPVALVALGMLVGMHTSVQGRREKRLFAAAVTEAAATGALVTAGLLLIPPIDGPPPLVLAVVLAVCAASSTAASWRATTGGVITERIGDLDALLPIVVGAAALAWLRTPSPTEAALLTLQACGVALVIVAAAWLLIGGAASETEQRVFTVALLLLLGGAADYLSLSSLFSGLVAGFFLERVGGSAREAISRDVLQFERPLVALVLLVIGARVDVPPASVALGLAYLLLRSGGKLMGGWMAARVAGAAAPRHLGAGLLSPGVLGLAFALSAARTIGPEGAIVLAAATVGTLGSELIATLVPQEPS